MGQAQAQLELVDKSAAENWVLLPENADHTYKLSWYMKDEIVEMKGEIVEITSNVPNNLWRSINDDKNTYLLLDKERKKIVDEIGHLLSQSGPNHLKKRCIFLVGEKGTGRGTIAQTIADDYTRDNNSSEFPHGVFVVDCREFTNIHKGL